MTFLKAKPIFFTLAVFALLLGIILTPAPSHAQQKRLKFSTTEDIALAFYKTGGKVPNFERWIKEREPYNLTPWARREAMMKQEMSRLQLAYRNFNPTKDFLIIRTFVDLNPQEHISKAGEKTYTLPINFSKAPDALYFPYDFLGERIVVMPNKIDLAMNSTISENQYKHIKESLRYSSKNTMIVRLRATEGDLSKPYMIDGIPQWVLKADIVSLEVWSSQGTLMWEQTANWYIAPETRRLNKLFNSRPPGTNEKGAVKPLF